MVNSDDLLTGPEPAFPDQVQSMPGGRDGFPYRWSRLPEEHHPQTLYCRGNSGLLVPTSTALFCSRHCCGRLLSRTYDVSQRLRREGRTVISGFHAPMEQEALELLLKSPHGLVMAPARSVHGVRLKPAWSAALQAGRFLLVAPFPEQVKRADEVSAAARNRFVAGLADQVLITHARPGGLLHGLAREAMTWGIPVVTLDDPENRHLLDEGAGVFAL